MKKRIVICSDGTWNSPENEQPTNVLLLARSIAPEGGRGVRQVVFYDWGVGSDGQKLAGGLTGAGIDKNIQDLYRFLVHNYEPGDELYFFGFSRGAYTVRSLAGFLRNCGLLRREHAARIPEAYRRYRKRGRASHPDAASSVGFRERFAVEDLTPIRFVGVFDTVGNLGIPVTFWGLLDDEEALFHDTEPSRIIRCARHALAIDEEREDFGPALWSPKDGLDLKQVWFAGNHSDVGGGYPDDHRLADTAGLWMAAEAETQGLRIEPQLRDWLGSPRGGTQHDERKGLFKLRGRVPRRLPEGALVHRSVKERWERRAAYDSPAFAAHLGGLGGDWSRVRLEG